MSRHTGHHLIHPHTLKHLQTTQWRPNLLNRKGYEQWEKEGSLTLLDRAREKLHDILERHRPTTIPEEKLQAIQHQVDQFKTQGVV